MICMARCAAHMGCCDGRMPCSRVCVWLVFASLLEVSVTSEMCGKPTVVHMGTEEAKRLARKIDISNRFRVVFGGDERGIADSANGMRRAIEVSNDVAISGGGSARAHSQSPINEDTTKPMIDKLPRLHEIRRIAEERIGERAWLARESATFVDESVRAPRSPGQSDSKGLQVDSCRKLSNYATLDSASVTAADHGATNSLRIWAERATAIAVSGSYMAMWALPISHWLGLGRGHSPCRGPCSCASCAINRK